MRGGIYLLYDASSERLKIGRSSDVLSRVRKIALTCPRPECLQLFFAVEFYYRAYRLGFETSIEAEMHNDFRDQRLHGEWFSTDRRVARTVLLSIMDRHQVGFTMITKFPVLD